jgi:protein SCO1/2
MWSEYHRTAELAGTVAHKTVQSQPRTMRRRTYLRTAAIGTVGGIAGCLGGSGGDSNTYLSDPGGEWDPETLPHPAYGQELPEVTLTDPVADRAVTTTEFDRDVFVTFFYSHCMSICPILISVLERIQEKAAADGHREDVVFLAVTFDPQRDDGERLHNYGEKMDVSLDSNWHFLRPDSRERAKTVVQETFGVRFERTEGNGGATTTGTANRTATTEPDATDTDETAGNDGTTTPGSTPAAMEGYMFAHQGLILLANRDDYVERSYLSTNPSLTTIYDDFETLRGKEG